MDLEAVHHFLDEQSYWANGIPFEIVRTALKNSFCIGIFDQEKQIGFARLITDYATYAYLADVYVLESHQGQGLAKMMMKYLMEQQFVQGLRRIQLATVDAHGLYRQFDFRPPENPEQLMEIRRKNVYAAE